MNNSHIDNPLFSPQREKSGSKTFEKYQYQYHWALIHALDKMPSKCNYSVFVELHEDVVSTEYLQSHPIHFDYFQIKCMTNTKLSVNKIAVEKKNGSTIFEKLLSSYKDKSLTNTIKSLNLVSQSGFSFKLKKDGVFLEKICISDLKDEDKNILETCIDSLNLSNKIHDIFFIQPNLQEKNQDTQVIGHISRVINNIYPNKNFNPCSIYNSLINDLYAKGTNIVDYKSWDEVIEKKSLTKNNIKKVISNFVEDPQHSIMLQEHQKILDELPYKSLKKIAISRAFNKLIIESYDSTSYDSDIEKFIQPIVSDLIGQGLSEIEDIISHVKNQISSSSLNQLISSDEEIIARVIFCILKEI